MSVTDDLVRMSENSLTGEDKEILKRRLELLQIEYERTAQRLQRAERREAVRRHVQNRISDQSQLLQVNMSGRSTPSPAPSTVSNPHLLSNPSQHLETSKKLPQVHFLLPEGLDASPCPSPSGCRSPTHRLRSRRSRLRLQTRERVSDTDDRPGMLGEGLRENRYDKVTEQDKAGEQAEGQQNMLEMNCVEGKEKSDAATGQSEEAKKRNRWKEEGSDDETSEEKPRSVLSEGVRGSESNCAVVLTKGTEAQMSLQSTVKEFSVNRSAAEVFPNDQSEAKISCAVRLVDSSSQLSSAVADQSFMQTQSSLSDGLSDHPNEGLPKSAYLQTVMEETVGVADDGHEHSVTVLHSSGKAAFLDSCTLVDGLPFPVEYYVRTTRRMAAARSSIDLDAVIHSQLMRGKCRRRPDLPQTRRGGHVTVGTFQPSGKPLDQPRSRRRGHRGRRGCRRTRAVGTQVPPSTQCLLELETANQAEGLLQSQSSISTEPFPQATLSPMPEAVPSPGPTLRTEPVAVEAFKNLSDSQLYLDCNKNPPGSEVYPIFRRRCGQAERSVLHSEKPANTNDCTHFLSSLASLIQALRNKDVQNLGNLLTAFDLQDFHLPDDVFGKLKLERLRLSCMSMETPVPHYTAFGACQGKSCHDNRCYDFRNRNDGDNLGVQPLEREWFVPEPLPPSVSLEGSFPLSQSSPSTQVLVDKLNTDQSEKLTEPMNQLHSKAGSQAVTTKLRHEASQRPEDYVPLSNTYHLNEFTVDENKPQTYPTDLPDLQTLEAADMQSPANHNDEGLDLRAGQNSGKVPLFQTELKTYGPNEHRKLMDEYFLSPVVPTLSLPLTSHSQCGPSLPSVGITPHPSMLSSHPVLIPLQTSPSNQSIASCPSQQVLPEPVPATAPGMVAIGGLALRETWVVGQELVHGRRKSQEEEDSRLGPEPVECAEPVTDIWRSPGTQRQAQGTSEFDVCEKDHHTEDTLLVESFPQDIAHSENGIKNISEHEFSPQTMIESQQQTETRPGGRASSPTCALAMDIDGGGNTKPCVTSELAVLLGDSANPSADDEISLASKRTKKPAYLDIQSPEAMRKPHLYIQSPEVKAAPQKHLTETTCCKVLSCGSLVKTHTFKALEAGCVLDVCLVRWPCEGWCVCVAGEWSVYVWAQKVEGQQWELLHTWTFTQSVISLQEVPDSSGLVCVFLGRLDITEARILCCPGMDVQFSQVELYKGALQAVVAVSDCRLVCCPVFGGHQKATVFTLAQDGRVAESLPLVSTNLSIQSLAAVEGEKDALIGWTDCKTLLIWNMKSGQLLQTIWMAEAVSTATCLRGYSYRGMLCVLLQSACGNVDGSAPFTVVAVNPITSKLLPLPFITNLAPPTSRLVDGDVCESNLVGVFQSDRLAIWDLRRGVANVFENGVAELCRLARWAGPNTLLAGYLTGDVSLYQYKPTGDRTRCH